MIKTQIDAFDKQGAPICEVVFKFSLVCCIYKSRRGVASAQAIRAKGAKDNAVKIQVFRKRIYNGKTYTGAI